MVRLIKFNLIARSCSDAVVTPKAEEGRPDVRFRSALPATEREGRSRTGSGSNK